MAAYFIFAAILLTTVVVLWYRLNSVRDDLNHSNEMVEMKKSQLSRETGVRESYERAMGLSAHPPNRSQELWARANQGDELAEAILIEQLSIKTQSPEAFVR